MLVITLAAQSLRVADQPHFKSELDQLYRLESRKIFATLVRLLGDLDLAEEALHDAFAEASESWPEEGMPNNPVSWLISAGRFKSVDRLRREKNFQRLLSQQQNETSSNYSAADETEEYVEDDVLRLIFTCCHPAVSPEIKIALTLREVCGLTTENIAQAFLLNTTAMAQRIVRGKNKIRNSAIPFELPAEHELNQRLDAVLLVIYLIFNEGYSATSGASLLNVDLSNEAIRLASLLANLIDDAEIFGLLALLLFQDARKAARVDNSGQIILLENQDRSLWDENQIQAGLIYLQKAMKHTHGVYTLQAAIAFEHARAREYRHTNWQLIEKHYADILSIEPTPIFKLNHAVAVSMAKGPEAGLKIVDALIQTNELKTYPYLFCAQGEMLFQQKHYKQALKSFNKALGLTSQLVAQQSIKKRIEDIQIQII